MTTLKNKPQYKTFSVTKDDGTTVQIGRVALQDLNTLLEFQDKLIKYYVDVNGAIGEIMGDPEVISLLTSVCSLIPIIEKKAGELVYLNYEDIQENWEQLILLFFNGGLNAETREVDQVIPSHISQLHFFPYSDMITKYHEKKKEQDEKLKK